MGQSVISDRLSIAVPVTHQEQEPLLHQFWTSGLAGNELDLNRVEHVQVERGQRRPDIDSGRIAFGRHVVQAGIEGLLYASRIVILDPCDGRDRLSRQWDDRLPAIQPDGVGGGPDDVTGMTFPELPSSLAESGQERVFVGPAYL